MQHLVRPAALPDFALEVHFGRWEFAAEHNLAASDGESMSIGDLLALAGRDPSDLTALRMGYGPVEGSVELRQAIAATYQRIDADDVLCFAGAEEAIFWAMQLLLGPGDHGVVTVPNYQSMESVAVASGASITGLPLWTGSGDELRWELDLDRLEAALRAETRLVAINFPNNPTGFVPPPAAFDELVRLCDARGIRVLSDEVYRGVELDPARRLDQAADRSEPALSIGVMSKAYGLPGLRIGWVVGPTPVVEKLWGMHDYTSIAPGALSDRLARVALAPARRARILERTRDIIRSNYPIVQRWVDAHAPLLTHVAPDAGAIVFVRYRHSINSTVLVDRLREEQSVLVVPGDHFDMDGYLRIGFGTEPAHLALSLERVGEVLDALKETAGDVRRHAG